MKIQIYMETYYSMKLTLQVDGEVEQTACITCHYALLGRVKGSQGEGELKDFPVEIQGRW